MGTASSRSEGTYVYCIARADALGKRPSLKAPPLMGAGPLRILCSEDLVAVVSDAFEPRYSVSRKNLLAHERVIEEVLEKADVLPVRLGLVARDDDEVKEVLLAQEHAALTQALERIRGRVELGLKVTWEESRLFTELYAEHPEFQAGAAAEEQTLDEQIQVGQAVEQAINEKQAQEVEAILADLRPLTVELVQNPPIAEMMLLNAAFLVDRDNVPPFDERVRELGEKQAGRMAFKYVGPLPPYNFVNLTIGGEPERGAA